MNKNDISKKMTSPRNFHLPKLYTLLKTLSKKELSNFLIFLKSPFYNQNKNLIRLFSYVRSHYPKFDTQKLGKAVIFKTLFPNDDYKERKISDMMSDLSILVEQFLCAIEIKKDKELYRDLKIRAFGKRNLFRYFEKELNASISALEAEPAKGVDSYRKLLYNKQLLYAHPDREKLKIGIPGIGDIMESLDKFYAISKLQYACEIGNRANILQEKMPILLLEQVRRELIQCFGKERIVIDIFCQIIDFQKSGKDEVAFKKVKTAFFQNISSISKQNQYAILMLLINYASIIVNSGDETYRWEQFDLFKRGYENEVWLINGRMRSITYTNIATLAAGLKEFSWAEAFIEKAAIFLKNDIREIAQNMSRAYCLFQQKRFNETESLLQNLENAPFPYNLRGKSLQLRIYYELTQTASSFYSLFHSKCNSFQKSLSREKVLTKKNMKAHQNAIMLIRKLANYKEKIKYNKRLRDNLLQQLEAKDDIAIKKWLKEKINEV